GIVLGGFYSAVAIGVTIAFGMLDIVNIAHPAFMIAGAYLAFFGWENYGFDPFVSMVVFTPCGYLFGRAFYRAYHYFFERRGDESLQGLAFFFGILFIVESGVVLVFGVDYRSISEPYLESSVSVGFVSVPWRMLVPFLVGLGMLGRVLLIIIQPVEPSITREYIGRAFAICVLGGIASIPGTLVASLILGVAEALTTIFFGPSWSPAVSFGLLLLTLILRPGGIFGR